MWVWHLALAGARLVVPHCSSALAIITKQVGLKCTVLLQRLDAFPSHVPALSSTSWCGRTSRSGEGTRTCCLDQTTLLRCCILVEVTAINRHWQHMRQGFSNLRSTLEVHAALLGCSKSGAATCCPVPFAWCSAMVVKKLGEELTQEYLDVLEFLGAQQGLKVTICQRAC